MNVFGIGTLELLVILVVAFIALGPGKTIEVARTIGRMTREARRAFTDIMDAASITDEPDGSPRRQQPDASRTPDAPAQPPSEPLPMPSHLQEPGTAPDGQPPGSQPEEADPDSARQSPPGQ